MGNVTTKTQILETKLCPPMLPPILVRERLLWELDAAWSVKLTAIVAGTGYGKSTLAREFLSSWKPRSIWYQLEQTDRDLSEFFSCLVTAFRKEHLELGDRTLKLLESTKNVPLASRNITTTLISEINTHIKEDFFIVLDDFHEVNDSPEIIEALDFFLDHLPQNLHLVILSRSKINLDLSHLRTYRDLIELKESDLRFTPEETAGLFSEVFGLTLRDDHIAALSSLTEGWISGLVLSCHALKNKKEDQMDAAIKDLVVPTSDISEYLSMVVYKIQSNDIKEFVTKTSILSNLSPDFCDELLGIGDSRKILTYLTEERLSTIPLDEQGEWYRYHHSMEAFLGGILAETCSTKEIVELNRRAASLWEKQGEPEQALHHYMESKDYEKAADILETIAYGLIKASRINFLHHELDLLPNETLKKHPWLIFDLAAISDMQGDYQKAYQAYQDAASLFEKGGDVDAQARSIRNAVAVLGMSGRPDEAKERTIKVLEITPPDSPYWYEAVAFISTASSVWGLPSIAEQCLKEALAHADEVESDAARARLFYWCGLATFHRAEYNKAYEVLLKACQIAERIDLINIMPLIYAILSQTVANLGRLTEAKEIADKGVALSERFDLIPMIFLNHSSRAVILSFLGDHDAAREDISIAVSLSEGYEPGMEVLFTELYAGEAYMICRESSQAIKHFRRVEQIAKKNGYLDMEILARLGVICESISEIGAETAREEVRSIIESLKGTGTGFTLISSYLLMAFLEATIDGKKAARQAAETAIELCEVSGLIGWWQEYGDLLLPVLADIFSRGKHLNYLERLFKFIGANSLPFLQKLTKNKNTEVRDKAQRLVEDIARHSGEPLMIKMLGPFELVRGEEKIPRESWKSKKALSLLKYLAAHRGRGMMPKDVLIELFWPNSDPESALRSLNVALTALRKTLEPQAIWGKSSYLVVSKDSLRLELGNGGCIDLELFQDNLEESKMAEQRGDHKLYLRTLKEAASLYRGDFLAEDPYRDWYQLERERINDEYLDLLKDIASDSLRKNNREDALHYVDEAIKVDPAREELYRIQMDIYCQIGNRVGIERAFYRCRKYLKENFDVSPSPDTVALYQRLR